MVVSINPIKDATIYEYYPTKNTGTDQIIELLYDVDYTSASRILMKFNTADISTIVSGVSNPQYILRLYASEQYEIPEDYTIKAFPLSQDWSMGIGKFYNNPETEDGVIWNSTGTVDWIDSGSAYTMVYNYETGGGSWNSNYSASLDLNYETRDLDIDISTIVTAWLSGSISNYGLIVKVDDEYNLNQDLELKYFSKDTHTVYEPKLFINYDTSQFTTGSLEALEDGDISISIKNLRSSYYTADTVRLYVHAREKYIQRTYSLTNPYLTSKYLPETTYYSIIDGSSKTTIIPFSDYTKVNLNADDANYFDLYMNNFYPERHYKIIFKVVWSDRQQIYDNNLYFKVIE